MAMGSTNRVVLNDEMQKAKGVCDEYRATISTLVLELESKVFDLLSSGFQGEAANGFKDFFDNNIKAFFAQGATFDKFVGMFDKEAEGLFDSIEKALVIGEGLDPTLGTNNRNVGKNNEQAE
ncbi:MAG: hypothetical protein UD936_10615 [Acutalibacteraceae bacterium]|nr:hypothetical protein [Acutalibacteraceae bacterium]